MMKILIIIAAATLLTLLACQKEETPQPTQVQPTTTTTTTNPPPSGNSEYGLYVWVFNTFPTTTPMCDLDTMFNSIVINGTEMVDSLKRDMTSFIVANMGATNNSSMTLFSLRFNAPTDILATPFTITMDANGSADLGGSTVNDVYMMVANGITGTNGTGAEHDFTSHCSGTHTYTVTVNTQPGNSDRFLLTSPCQ